MVLLQVLGRAREEMIRTHHCKPSGWYTAIKYANINQEWYDRMNKISQEEHKRRLDIQAKLCRRNLKSSRVKCCSTCPWRDELIKIYPEMEELFERNILFAAQEPLWVEGRK